ncbi:hypothetical protein ACM39_03355 [Chryseobacterium sp. FH2]|uniref:hypothetical protein n=1 Tax=Chryseobacterium sp. FH2 TaxID=1674291 RepID=UPI00065AD8D1|nr:hypothetical protein [Chryseobacterium sp. FH2]KMQ69161.1 hypothetical protein ACM39_03355 [Chryseobacterium sp. FH2]
MNYKKYLDTQIKKTESNLSSRLKNNDFDFFYNCIHEFIEDDKEEFVQAFTEFGMQFENKYNVSGIIQKIFYEKSESAIIQFVKDTNIENFKKLANSYYWLNLAFIKGLKNKQDVKGEFFQDTVFASFLAYCFYPQALQKTLNYLETEYEQSLKEESEKILPEKRKYDKYYGYADVFQLLKELLSKEENYPFNEMIDVPVESHYDFAIKNYLSQDISVVNEVLEKLAQFHINNPGESYLDTFNHDCWKSFPLEMISILICRKRQGLSNEGISHPLIQPYLSFIFEAESLPHDELTKKLEEKIID